jgi:hypothetical protein
MRVASGVLEFAAFALLLLHFRLKVRARRGAVPGRTASVVAADRFGLLVAVVAVVVTSWRAFF